MAPDVFSADSVPFSSENRKNRHLNKLPATVGSTLDKHHLLAGTLLLIPAYLFSMTLPDRLPFIWKQLGIQFLGPASFFQVVWDASDDQRPNDGPPSQTVAHHWVVVSGLLRWHLKMAPSGIEHVRHFFTSSQWFL